MPYVTGPADCAGAADADEAACGDDASDACACVRSSDTDAPAAMQHATSDSDMTGRRDRQQIMEDLRALGRESGAARHERDSMRTHQANPRPRMPELQFRDFRVCRHASTSKPAAIASAPNPTKETRSLVTPHARSASMSLAHAAIARARAARAACHAVQLARPVVAVTPLPALRIRAGAGGCIGADMQADRESEREGRA